MARLKGNIEFTGSLGELSAYKRRDSKEIILRTKGGASKKKIKTSPSFARTRLLNKEWGGCSKAGTAIRVVLAPLKHMADFNISGPLNALSKKIQKLDILSSLGERNIMISKYCNLYEGFNLTEKKLFDSIVRRPVTALIDTQTGIATVNFPELQQGINLINSNKKPFYRFVISFGAVSDVIFDQNLQEYIPIEKDMQNMHTYITIDWHPWRSTFKSITKQLSLQDYAPTSSLSLFLAIGIEFGDSLTSSIIEPVNYSGSAKILATGN
jgi:hypothetical protein